MTRFDQILQGNFPLPRWVRVVSWLWLVLALAPFAAASFGYSALVPAGGYPAAAAAIAVCIAISFGLMLPLLGPMTAATRPGQQMQSVGRIVLLCFTAMFMGYAAALAGLPIAAAVLTGSRVEAVATVERAEARSTPRCDDFVVLRERQAMFDSLCRLPAPMLQRLVPGTQVTLLGWGFAGIMLVDRIVAVEPPKARPRTNSRVEVLPPGTFWSPGRPWPTQGAGHVPVEQESR